MTSSATTLRKRASQPIAGRVDVILADAREPVLSAAVECNAHVLVCIFGETIDGELIRQGRILADLTHGRLTVLYPFSLGFDGRNRAELRRDRISAHEAGAQLVELPAYSPFDGIVEYANARAVTHLVLSDRPSGSWYAARTDSLPERLADQLGAVDLYLLTGTRNRDGAGL